MMDKKMRKAFDAWGVERSKKIATLGVPTPYEYAEWTLDYLRSQQEPVATAEEERIVEHVNIAPGTDLYTHPLPSAPVVHAVFETVDSRPLGATGTTEAPIKRVEVNDDGSFTVVINHWPVPSAPAVPDMSDLTDRLVEASSAIADQDDRAAQAILREVLSMLAAAPSPTEENSHD